MNKTTFDSLCCIQCANKTKQIVKNQKSFMLSILVETKRITLVFNDESSYKPVKSESGHQ